LEVGPITSTQWLFIPVLLGFIWAVVSAIAHMAWRADARDELRAIGVKPPPWWSREIFETLMLLRDNRARLSESGQRLIRVGTFICWNLTGIFVVVATVLAVTAFVTRASK
jgi:hypothetical protein